MRFRAFTFTHLISRIPTCPQRPAGSGHIGELCDLSEHAVRQAAHLSLNHGARRHVYKGENYAREK